MATQDMQPIRPLDLGLWCGHAERFLADACEARAAAGVVVGLSGGVDSSVVAALAARALGPPRVLGVLLPERDSDPASARLALTLAERLEVEHVTLDLTASLRKLGVYDLAPKPIGLPRRWQQRYVRKRVAQSGVSSDGSPLLAAMSNRAERSVSRGMAFCRAKVRLRMVALYLVAEQRNMLVAGTCNRTEWLTGLFAPWGDTAADIMPLFGLYKTEVFRIAREFGVPAEIIDRAPSPDLAPGVTDEQLLGLPYERLDTILCAIEAGSSTEEICRDSHYDAAEVAMVRALVDGSERFRRLPLALERTGEPT